MKIRLMLQILAIVTLISVLQAINLKDQLQVRRFDSNVVHGDDLNEQQATFWSKGKGGSGQPDNKRQVIPTIIEDVFTTKVKPMKRLTTAEISSYVQGTMSL
ncbi:UNKNOWN [Stylonychia lemnae]|uniref:Uncharacterized protein n=1 Tax=Stylonychia lemnae TaxID=5949 RepID=A0A078APM0_STYLE|nr:UNKNOWN [Stylonychia lemnae]|eukprot:CDW83906.1 UNKNOWN [Stylonychia lemnae]